MADSTPERQHFRFTETAPLPPEMAFIVGDCLQNMRSALDYLVWELVLANGENPDERNMFPIATAERLYESQLSRHRLRGVAPEAMAVIRAIQPFHAPDPPRTMLVTLDSLTNINKHRRVLLTSLNSVGTSNPPLDFPHMPVIIERMTSSGQIEETHLRVFVAMQDGAAKDREITLVLHAMAHGLTCDIFPLFQKFLEDPGTQR